jgi:hypothetical protein
MDTIDLFTSRSHRFVLFLIFYVDHIAYLINTFYGDVYKTSILQNNMKENMAFYFLNIFLETRIIVFNIASLFASLQLL